MRAEGDHDVAVCGGGVGDLLVRNAAPPHLRLGIDREVDEADLLLAIERDRLVHRRPLARAEVLVGSAVVLLAVVVEGVAARHLEVGVDVDGDEVGVVHGGRLRRTAPRRRSTSVRGSAGQGGAAPGHVLVGAAENEGVAVFGRREAAWHIEQAHRHAACLRGVDERRRGHRGVEPQQRVVGPEGVVERAAVVEPEVRRAAARHGRRGEAAHRVGRRRFAVVGDQRRAFVEVAEVQAGAAELLYVELDALRALLGADRVAFGARLLDPRRHGAARLDHLLRVVHREARDLLGDRLALDLVGVEHAGVGPAGEVRRQVPREVERIGDAGVHAVAGVGHPQVCRIAADQHAPVAKALGHQAAAGPVFLAQDLVLEVGADAEDRADRCVAVDALEVFRAGHQVVVHQPGLAPVDGEAHAAAPRVRRIAAPGALAGNEAEQPGRADVGGLHALDHRRAGEGDAERFAHHRAAAVAADEKTRVHAQCGAAVEVARLQLHAVFVLCEADAPRCG